VTPGGVTLPALAKVNLFLRVLSREEDGYHDIETLLCLVSLSDTLRAERREGRDVTIDVAGADVGPAAQNLAVRAATLVLESVGHRFGIHLTLTKRIPVRAGLGGGSSDAAAALHAVNRLATADAYGWVDEARQSPVRRGALALDLESLSSWGDIARMAGNDFESAVFGRHGEIRAAFEALVGTRPLLCRMSGSGATIFAIYRSARDREDAVMMLGRKHGTVTSVETIAVPAPGPT
jgi:4-diphosphocytidyl-2C-methyl-D-erythritol kinase